MEPFNGVLLNFEINILQNKTHYLMSSRQLKMNCNVKGHKFHVFSGTRKKNEKEPPELESKGTHKGWKDLFLRAVTD